MKKQIRANIREKRLKLSTSEQQFCAARIARRLFLQSFFKNAQHIALYMSFAAEVDPSPILWQAFHLGKSCYLPVLKRNKQLSFVKVLSQSPLFKNRYGIYEPEATPEHMIAPQDLDLVLLPLVAFDAKLHRLGMGAGYYDRTFSFKRKKRQKPLLIGLGYDFQRVNQLPFSSLDVSLDTVVTEKRIYRLEA